MPGDAPGFYHEGRTITVRLSGPVSAKLATFRRQEMPDKTDEEAAEYLIADGLIRAGLLDPPEDRDERGDD